MRFHLSFMGDFHPYPLVEGRLLAPGSLRHGCGTSYVGGCGVGYVLSWGSVGIKNMQSGWAVGCVENLQRQDLNPYSAF